MKYFRLTVILLAIFFIANNGHSQNCNLTISGNVYDEASESPLSFVNIYIQETQEGTTTDDDGNFSFENICTGEYHFILSHIGCEGKKIHFDVAKDTTLRIGLSHTSATLGTVVVEGKKDNLNNQPNLAITRQSIEDNTNQNLAGLLENEAGIHLIKNGSGISKPVVHGLYGNRLIILNNGVAQSGQQWGNGHSPEIDPFAADKITVLKGANALEHGSGNLGSVVLVEPKRITREPHLHGQVNYAFESNGRGHTLNTRLEKYSKAFAWRVNGTLKRYGDKKTADYFLNNTGLSEQNFSLQLEKSWKDKLLLDIYASTFNTQLGVLRGSHIGNVTDLNEALVKEVPFFTEPDFSYGLEAPKQEVHHHLVKTKAKYFISDNQTLEVLLAGQINNRKEFDVRRNGRTEIPALSLLQFTFNGDIKYTQEMGNGWDFKIGNQNVSTDNANNPETKILPLIPDYNSWKSGVYSILTKTSRNIIGNVGVRYDYEQQFVKAISNDLPRRILRFNNRFHNISGLANVKMKIGDAHSVNINTGYAMRNPAINELYSYGLHQGVSGIEEGDTSLITEKAWKTTLEYKWFPNSNFTFSALGYSQLFQNYIYLNPQNRFRTTIRGAFPVFTYEQTNAIITGLDLSAQITIEPSLFAIVKYSYLRGTDTSNSQPLVFMPPNSLFASLTYRSNKKLKISSTINLENTEIELTNRAVFQQNNILEEQDFSEAPPTYNLIGLKVSSNLILPSSRIRCFAKVDNLLNVQYRDYLNRQRYYADDIGISATVGINVKF